MVSKNLLPEAGVSLFICHKEIVFCGVQNPSILKGWGDEALPKPPAFEIPANRPTQRTVSVHMS